MDPLSRPDPSFRSVALNHHDWLDTQWQKAHTESPHQATEADPAAPNATVISRHSRELNACEMILVILGGILMFVGFLAPMSVLAGLFCFILALVFSAYSKA